VVLRSKASSDSFSRNLNLDSFRAQEEMLSSCRKEMYFRMSIRWKRTPRPGERGRREPAGRPKEWADCPCGCRETKGSGLEEGRLVRNHGASRFCGSCTGSGVVIRMVLTEGLAVIAQQPG